MKIEKINIDKIDSYVNSKIILIVCSSYEDRCLSIAQAIDSAKIEKALIAYNEDIAPYINKNCENLISLFSNKSERVALNTNDPIKTADNLKTYLQANIKSGCYILVDITTFTHESLLILIKLLDLITEGKSHVKFAYTGAKTYGVVPKKILKDKNKTKEDISESIWLSKGIINIRNVLGFSGDIFPLRKTHLIILVGFEYERALELIKRYEPNYLSLGFGKAGGSISEKHHQANKKFHSLLTEIASNWQKVNSFEFSCNDPVETQKAIINQSRIHPDTNVVVAPMNTKISTLGAYLANKENAAIQICYAKPLKYNYENYSTPGDTCYIIDLPEIFK